MRKRRVILLGSTGSIGASAIKVAASIPDRMEIVGMAARQSAAALAESANRLRPSHLCLVDPAQLPGLRRRLNYRPSVFPESCHCSWRDPFLMHLKPTWLFETCLR